MRQQRLFIRVQNGAGETLPIKQRIHRALVGTRHNCQRAIGFIHIIQEQKRCDDVVIGMRRIGEVLMIQHLGLRTRQLQIDLAMMEFHIGANQFGHHFRHVAVTHRFQIGGRDIGWVIDPPKRRLFGGMFLAHIETRATIHAGRAEGFCMGAAFVHPAGDLGPQPRQKIRGDSIRHHQAAIAPEGILLFLRQNTHDASPFIKAPPNLSAKCQRRHVRSC